MTDKSVSFEAVVGRICTSYVLPRDYSTLTGLLRQHKYVLLTNKNTPTVRPLRTGQENIYRVLFVCVESVIVQEIELTQNLTRFKTERIMFSDWVNRFVEWGDESEGGWNKIYWEEGFRMEDYV